ncbi:cell division protein FtsQ/DivIB [Kineococcus gynurae]|uniref:Cell division protein FtsQ/DivIB n=1 Tax=Kineococcus gynurae TaxID=452979 RepID=A0ABV5LXX6_9ACTN
MSRPTPPRRPDPTGPVPSPTPAPERRGEAHPGAHPGSHPGAHPGSHPGARGDDRPARPPRPRPPASPDASGVATARAARPAVTRRPGPRRPGPERIADLAVVRASRRWHPGRRTLLGALAVLLLLGAAGWLLLASPFLRVETVRVEGTRLTDPAQVQRLAEAALGRPMLTAGSGEGEREVEALPFVASVSVQRHWPHELIVRVEERVGVAAVPAASGGVDLVDASGVVRLHAETPPPGVPLLGVDVARAGVGALEAARQVNAALPPDLRARVAEITASSPDDVRLRLAEGPEVVWGGADRPERKVEVLQRLLADPDVAGAERIDVSAPDAPAVAG